LEINSKEARTTAYNASGATSEEVLKTSRVAHAARVNVSQETRRASASAHDQSYGEDQSLTSANRSGSHPEKGTKSDQY